MQIIFQRLTAFFAALLSLFSIALGDHYREGSFPQIGVELQSEGTVRVMSFNIRTANVGLVGREDREDVVTAQILAVKPDSLGVQEANPAWMETLSAALPDYAWTGLARDGDGEGEYSAVFYRSDKYLLADSGTFWLSETPDKVSYGWGAVCRRICTWAVLENRETGAQYVHVNSHFDHLSDKARTNGATLIAAFIQEHFAALPVVFTADMNAQEDSPAYAAMTAAGLADAKYTAPDSLPYGTFHNRTPSLHAERVIDFILCSTLAAPVSFRTVTEGIDGRFVSDHFPLYADIIV